MKLSEMTLCEKCGFYRVTEHCQTNGCSNNPETHKHKGKKAN